MASLCMLNVGCGKVRYFFILLFWLVDVFLWCYELWREFIVRSLNTYIWVITRWFYQLPFLSVSLEDVGFFRVYDVRIKWKNNVILTADLLTFKIEKGETWRNMSLKLHVKNLHKIANAFDAFFDFTLYWRIFPFQPTSTGLEHNKEIQNNIKTKITRLQATCGKIVLKPRRKGQQVTGPSPMIVIKVKAAEAMFISGVGIFIINGRANRVTCNFRGRTKITKHRDQLIEMTCLRLKLVFPKDEPQQLSFRLSGTRLRITKNNVKRTLWALKEYKTIIMDVVDLSNDTPTAENEEPTEKPATLLENTQLAKVKFAAEDMVLSLGTSQVPEIAAVKVSLDLVSDNWMGKSYCTGSFSLQGVSISDVEALDPCIIIGNDLITASWHCNFISTHVYKRCFIFAAESTEILSAIVRPDYFVVFLALKQEFSFLTENIGRDTVSQLGEIMKTSLNEYCPRTQISSAFEGVSLCVELDVFEKLATCTLEDIRFQCTHDAENFSCDFTVKEIEVEDRINNVLALRVSNADGIEHNRSFHASVIRESDTKKRTASFQQFYGEIADLTIRIEEDLLLKLLVFCRVTSRKQLWLEEDAVQSETTRTPPTDGQPRPLELDAISVFFERLEFTSFNVLFCLSPKQELTEDLIKLKQDLGIPNGLPPCVENARLDFERLLRTSIYYRSIDALARDVKRHYLKEIGRQSGKILGSLHLLGNVTGLKDSIAEGLADLRETGDYLGFVGHVRNGLTDSYYKITDSWSAYVKTPIKISKTSSETAAVSKVATEPVIHPKTEQTSTTVSTKATASPCLLRNFTTSVGGWVFHSQDEDHHNQLESSPSLQADAKKQESPLSSCHAPSCDTSLRDGHSHVEEDCRSSNDMSTITTLTNWEVIPQQTQKQLKGQEFVRRLKRNLNDTETEELFICCLKLRYMDPNDKLNALITSKKVYLMTVGSPTRDNLVFDVLLEKIFEAKPKEQDDKKYLELIMRINGFQRLSVPSVNPGDNPLVRCDTLHLASKAAKRINKAKKMYKPSDDACPCKVLMNEVGYS